MFALLVNLPAQDTEFPHVRVFGGLPGLSDFFINKFCSSEITLPQIFRIERKNFVRSALCSFFKFAWNLKLWVELIDILLWIHALTISIHRLLLFPKSYCLSNIKTIEKLITLPDYCVHKLTLWQFLWSKSVEWTFLFNPVRTQHLFSDSTFVFVFSIQKSDVL